MKKLTLEQAAREVLSSHINEAVDQIEFRENRMVSYFFTVDGTGYAGIHLKFQIKSVLLTILGVVGTPSLFLLLLEYL